MEVSVEKYLQVPKRAEKAAKYTKREEHKAMVCF